MLYYFGRAIFRIIFKLFGSWEIEGRENVPPEGGVLLAPNHISFSTEVYRDILYDLLFCRSSLFGNISYNNEILEEVNVEYMKDYYIINKSQIIGVGEKIGPFWIPKINIRMPKMKKGDEPFINK